MIIPKKIKSRIVKYAIAVLMNLILFNQGVIAEIHYVSTTGNDTNAGTLALPWKTVTFASSNTNPGDTVYVKAGLYNEEVVISKDGSSDHPVVFIGYQNTPGDKPPVLANNADPYADFLATDMPLFDGGNRASGTGFDCQQRKYLVIKNFQIQNYEYGLLLGWSTQDAGNSYLYNVNIRNIGDVSSDYSGYALLLGLVGSYTSNYNIVDSCLVLNSAAEGISIYGNHNKINGCKVYCNQNSGSAATDYYLIITGSYNEVTSCYIERASGLSHYGHGFSCVDNAEQSIDNGNGPAIAAEYNVFKYCVAKNLGESFCVRHRTARYNLFYHCKAIGTHTGATGSSGGDANCIVIRDGANNNTFDGCIAESCNSGVAFNDTVEDGDTGSNPPGHPGDNNLIINCLILNSYIGVDYNDYSIPSDAGNNLIGNCTFFKTRYMFNAARSCKNMKYINDIFYGTLPATPGGDFKIGAYADDITPNGATTFFHNCDFYNVQGEMPPGFVTSAGNCISADPLFKDAATNDLHLQSGSPCINTGQKIDVIKTDYDSISRPQGSAYDMGAYESQVITAVTNILPNTNLISVFPNPASETLYVFASEPGFHISIYDMSGNELQSLIARDDKTEIKLGNFTSGIYFLLARKKNSQETIKFVIEK